ncbi:MAG: 16S rRNA (cytidine(1402)-2'-O)-methyltransferase [Dethiobacter sp.]|nr:16S rRNA (cytidine(1402)-2'-O)-methyltransferase [Dethiobacter sp.]
METGTLFLCPTPLGNLEDITLRVLRILGCVQVIAAEDTRHTRKLLTHFNINTRMTSYHEHNKIKKAPFLLDILLKGGDVALVSDAGMPGISDPGEELVKQVISHGLAVVPLPGPNAAITALVASGLPVAPFTFFGFLSSRGAGRKKELAEIMCVQSTAIFYEAPHRLVKALSQLAAISADRQVVVARELTKIHEEFVRGTLEQVLAHFQSVQPRGECTVLIGPPPEKESQAQGSPEQLVAQLLAQGMDKKEAVRQAASQLGISRREVYQKVCVKE